jgi:hypothetical protein
MVLTGKVIDMKHLLWLLLRLLAGLITLLGNRGIRALLAENLLWVAVTPSRNEVVDIAGFLLKLSGWRTPTNRGPSCCPATSTTLQWVVANTPWDLVAVSLPVPEPSIKPSYQLRAGLHA